MTYSFSEAEERRVAVRIQAVVQEAETLPEAVETWHRLKT